MDLETVYRALNNGTKATRGLLQEARMAPPEARQRLINDLVRQQQQIKACAAITTQSATKLAGVRERQYRNPAFRAEADARADATTQAALAAMDEEYAAVGGLINQLRALDSDAGLIAQLQRDGIIPPTEGEAGE